MLEILMRNRISLAIILALASLCPSFGQETRGNLLGGITDSSGATVPGASVEITHQKTGTKNRTVTNEEGRYQFLFILPGVYNVTVQANGFKTLDRNDIEVRTSDRVELNLSLQVGESAERVEVVGSTPLLETATASLGQVVDHRRLIELPLMHGNPMASLELAAGLAQSRTDNLGISGGRVFDNAWTTSFAIDGSTQNTHEITLDGVANTTTLGGAQWGRGQQTVAMTPPGDIVDEYRLQTASFDASTGYTTGAVINMGTKPGTSSFHGTAMFNKMFPDLNANQFFANRTGQEKSDFKYNRWSGTITGPVWLPKIYNGKDRTFFSYGYEGHKDAPPWGSVYTVPTAALKQGDFSSLLAIDPSYQIYDPSTAVRQADGTIQRQPFAGNIIPASRISSFAKNLLGYWPDPLSAGNADYTNNYPRPTMPDPNNYYSHSIRVDHNFSNSNRFFARIALAKNVEKNFLDAFKNITSGNSLYRYNRGLSLSDTHTISPNLVLDLKYGYTRFREDSVPKSQGYDITGAGFSSALASQIDPQAYAFPCITADVQLGCWNPSISSTDIHHFGGSLNWLKGTHNIRMGAEFRAYRKNAYNFGQGVPSLTFDSSYTNASNVSGSAPYWQGFAALLLGLPTTSTIQRNDSFAEQSKIMAFYIQDDWKATSKLTLSAGLRYEHETPLTERFNRSNTQFDFSTANPIQSQVKANYAQNPIPEISPASFNVAGGLLFAGGTNGNSLYSTPTKNFMPRVGLAWSVTPKTVIRAGYGIFFGYLGVRRSDVRQYGYSQTTTSLSSTDGGVSFRVNPSNISNPFIDGILNPAGSSLGLRTNLGQDISFFNANPKTPYAQRWQVSVQRQLPSNVVLEAAYVGNRTTHLEIDRDFNALPNQYLSYAGSRDQNNINRLSSVEVNPFYPLIPGTALGAETVGRDQLLRPYPQFLRVMGTTNDGFSWYHSLQLKLERRFANSFTLQGAYTWSKFMEATSYLNPADLYPEKVISAEDFPHRLSISGIYELPFGPGKKLLGNATGITRILAGGWQMEGVYTFQSGQALGFGNAIFYGDLKNIPLSGRNIDEWFNVDAGFERDASKQLEYNHRSLSSRFAGIRGDFTNQLNFSFMKNTHLWEGGNLQFRAEGINALNHAQFANPVTDPTSQAFGTVTYEKTSARAIQLGLKLLF